MSQTLNTMSLLFVFVGLHVPGVVCGAREPVPGDIQCAGESGVCGQPDHAVLLHQEGEGGQDRRGRQDHGTAVV